MAKRAKKLTIKFGKFSTEIRVRTLLMIIGMLLFAAWMILNAHFEIQTEVFRCGSRPVDVHIKGGK